MDSTDAWINFDQTAISWAESDIPKQRVADFYNQNKELYDQFTRPLYTAPATLCHYLRPHIEHRKGLTVIDVGAGSGHLATELLKILDEPESIDALEPAEEFLAKAVEANLYNRIYVEFMEGLNSTNIKSEEYDLVCASGSFIPGHIPLEGLYEITRITKIGGITAIIMRECYLRLECYKNWYNTLDRLVREGVLKTLLNTNGVDYHDEHKGALFIYEKIKNLKD